MKLSTLLTGNSSCAPPRFPEVEVTSLTADSREVVPGSLFAALSGTRTDGRAFVADALDQGARVILSARPERVPDGVVPLVSANPRKTFARLAARFHGAPSEALTVIGVTGTNGKTTVTYLLQAVLTHQGDRCGRLGTVDFDTVLRVRPATHTTPGPVALQEALAEMRAAGARYAALEVSSHALAQHRTEGVAFAASVFTNLTQDHLDYHGTLGHYARTKARLFRQVRPGGVAVVNADDPAAGLMTGSAWCTVVSAGFQPGATYRIEESQSGIGGSRLAIRFPGGRQLVHTPLVGRYNLSNIAAVFAVAHQLGVEPAAIAAALQKASGAPGRLERVPTARQLTLFVDYAHTPDALANVLKTLRAIAPGPLSVVFGCGGDRDRGKRPRMGALAAKLADRVYLTSDNPRTEDPARILTEVLAGMRDVRARVACIANRRRAIATALRAAEPGETVLIAGKGHENVQIVGAHRYPFDDRQVARELLGALDAGRLAPLALTDVPWLTRRRSAA